MSEWHDLGISSQSAAFSQAGGQTYSCNCIGPRNGEPYCACRMKGIIERDGRWIEPERDLGPVVRRSASALDGLNASIRKGT